MKREKLKSDIRKWKRKKDEGGGTRKKKKKEETKGNQGMAIPDSTACQILELP